MKGMIGLACSMTERNVKSIRNSGGGTSRKDVLETS
jgi:hypothetical protein